MTTTLSRSVEVIDQEESTFLTVKELVEHNLSVFTKTGRQLFVSSLSDEVWERYLAAFPPDSDPFFRERTSHDCNCCRNFVRNLGAVVNIEGNKVQTIWDNYEALPEPYRTVCEALSTAIKSSDIKSIFLATEGAYGSKPTLDNHVTKVRNREIHITWDHFHFKLPTRYQDKNPAAKIGSVNDQVGVFRRSLTEISGGSLGLLLENIESNTVYLGTKYQPGLLALQKMQEEYVQAGKNPLYLWKNYQQEGSQVKGTLVGTLLKDLDSGKDWENALRAYEAKAAPGNYMRPSPTVTPKMVENALNDIRKADLESALYRRCLHFHDVSVQDVQWVNTEASAKMQDPLKSMLLSEAISAARPKQGATKITPEELITLRPSTLEVVLNNSQLGNFVTLTAPVHPEVNRLFAWGNSYGWSYDGDLTDSIAQLVAKAGGNIKADMRASIHWFNADDLDIHGYYTGKHGSKHIFFNNKLGILDVDANAGQIVENPVENLSWSKVEDGEYAMKVNQFRKRSNKKVGFEAEFFFRGESVFVRHPKAVVGWVDLFSYSIVNGELKNFKVGHTLEAGVSTNTPEEKWGVKTFQPLAVQTIMLSPNHWEGTNKTGNKHWFFILKDCKNNKPVRGIYNEFLDSSLHKHRKVFELLGSKTKCEPTDDQLSGVGFSTTIKNKLSVLVDKRPYEVVFGSEEPG